MAAANWKYLDNQFLTATAGSRTKMNTIMHDHNAKLLSGAAEEDADARLAALRDAFAPVLQSWGEAYARWQNKKAGYGGGTATLTRLVEDVTRKPNAEANSPIEGWDLVIRGVAPQGSALYKTILPQGRAPFSEGGQDKIIEAVRTLGIRLSEQTTKAPLLALAGDVTAYYNQLRAARDAQQGLEGATDITADEIEASRVAAGVALYGDLGALMNIYKETPERVAAFFDLDTLREPPSKGKAAGGTSTPTPPATPPAQP